MYVVYRIEYLGNKCPKYYIGSTSEERIKTGYVGSVKSKKYGVAWKKESEENPHLFRHEILGRYETRCEAIQAEYEFQKLFNAVKCSEYANMSYAIPDGFFGMDVSGENNPMFGKKHSLIAKDKMSKSRKGKAFSEKHKENISKGINDLYASDKGVAIKKLLSIANRGENNPMFGKKGENNPNFGSTRSNETKRAISNKLKNHKRTNEHNAKLSSVYEIELSNNTLLLGRNISSFCEFLGFNTTSLLYTLKSKKYFRGFKVIRKITEFVNNDEKITIPLLTDAYSKLNDLSSVERI